MIGGDAVSGRTAQEARDVVRRIDELEARRDDASAPDDARHAAELMAHNLRERLEQSVRGAWEMMREWDRPVPAGQNGALTDVYI